MKPLGKTIEDYLSVLEERKKQSRAYAPHQLIGLNLAVMLKDYTHKSLYIKLAKDYDGDQLLSLAKSVAEKRDVVNRGAYFMRLLADVKMKKVKKS